MIKIITVGSLKEKYLKEAQEEYLKRISKYHKLNIIELPDNNIETETKNILKYIKPNDYVISLAIEGKQIDSVELSK